MILNKFFVFLKNYKLFRLIVYKFLSHKKYQQFKNLNLNHKSVVLDFGANVGDITQCLIDLYDCNIHAYEPNKDAFENLNDRFKNSGKVTTFNKAVGLNNEKGYLYLHISNKENPVKYSTGSSLLKEKENVNSDNFQDTEIVSIKNILQKFKCIDLIKIDIEGYEYEILPYITENKDKIKKVICELHGNPQKPKHKFLNNNYLNFVKKLKIIDPDEKWFFYHH